MAEIETITIRRFPENPEIPDKICAEINENEMLTWFINHFRLSLAKYENDLKIFHVEAMQAKKMYQKKPAAIALKPLQVTKLAEASFQEMLAAMKRIAKVRMLP